MCVYDIPSSWALTRHIRNEDHRKGAWNVSGFIDMLQPLHERYVESLESRLEKMETLLQRVRRTTELSPGYDISSNVALSGRRLYARTGSAA